VKGLGRNCSTRLKVKLTGTDQGELVILWGKREGMTSFAMTPWAGIGAVLSKQKGASVERNALDDVVPRKLIQGDLGSVKFAKQPRGLAQTDVGQVEVDAIQPGRPFGVKYRNLIEI
jgi:hypothetical protein